MMLRVERVGTESMQMEDAEAWMCACDVLFVRKESPFAYGSPRSATPIAHLHPHSLIAIQYGFSSTWSLGSRR